MGDPILRELPDDAPVLILMSGIAGGSHDKYLVRLGCCTFVHSFIRSRFEAASLRMYVAYTPGWFFYIHQSSEVRDAKPTSV